MPLTCTPKAGTDHSCDAAEISPAVWLWQPNRFILFLTLAAISCSEVERAGNMDLVLIIPLKFDQNTTSGLTFEIRAMVFYI